MTPTEAVLLAGGGLIAGTVNSIAGGGSLITFPLLVGMGLPGVAANVSNALSVAPGYAAGAVGSRPDLAGQGRRLIGMIPAAVAGTLCGSSLLLLLPKSVFDLVVPFLLLLAATMMAFQNRLKALAGSPKEGRSAILLQVAVFCCGVYGGYFNAAMGVLLMAALALVLDEPLRRISALKNVFSALVGVTTVLLYGVFGPVNWAVVSVLAPATIVGGYAGARLARRLPAEALRWTIVVFALVVAVVLFLT